METDKQLYQLFSASPSHLYELLGLSPPAAVRASSETFKELETSLDLILEPNDAAEPATLVEFQGYRDKQFIPKMMLRCALYRMRHASRPVRCHVVYLDREFESAAVDDAGLFQPRFAPKSCAARRNASDKAANAGADVSSVRTVRSGLHAVEGSSRQRVARRASSSASTLQWRRCGDVTALLVSATNRTRLRTNTTSHEHRHSCEVDSPSDGSPSSDAERWGSASGAGGGRLWIGHWYRSTAWEAAEFRNRDRHWEAQAAHHFWATALALELELDPEPDHELGPVGNHHRHHIHIHNRNWVCNNTEPDSRVWGTNV